MNVNAFEIYYSTESGVRAWSWQGEDILTQTDTLTDTPTDTPTDTLTHIMYVYLSKAFRADFSSLSSSTAFKFFSAVN